MALLAFFGLWETTLLAGAAAVSVPVVIHLLNRRRYRIVTWAAMRFLLMAQRQNSRRMRLEQIFLLLCRMALILTVLLAMASVTSWAENVWALFWPEGGVNRVPTARVHHIIVLDGSLSMSQASEDSSCFERAKELALRKINDAPAGDGFSILLMKEHPVWIIAETAQDKRKVARELHDLTGPTHGNASVPTALNMIASKLADNQKRFPGQTVYFFTDMQKATWALARSDSAKDASNNGDSVLADISKYRAKIVFVDVGRDDVSNHAVTDLRIYDTDLRMDKPFVTTGAEVPITATIQNFGNVRKDKLRVELYVGRARDGANDPPLSLKRVGQQTKEMAANGSASVIFNYTFPQAGTYAVQVRIEDDALLADNVRTLIVTVKDRIEVLLVNGNSAINRFDQATAYVRFALDPFGTGAVLRPTPKNASQFSEMNDKELLSYDAIFFADVGQVGDAEVRRLKMFLRMGGGVIYSAGPEVWKNRDLHNQFLFENGRGLLPGPFGRILMEGQFLFDTQTGDFKQPPLNAFEDEKDKISLNSSRFQRYMVLELPSDSPARPIMSFLREERPLEKGEATRLVPTGHPALLEYHPPLPKLELAETISKELRKGPITPQRYRGKMLIFASTLNMDWGSWPVPTSFLPMMREITRLAVSGKLRGNSQTIGQVLEEAIPSEGVDVDVEVSTFRPRTQADEVEAGKVRRVRTQSQGDISVFRWTDTDLSGIYSMFNLKDSKETLFAVNCPSGTAEQNDNESDLIRVGLAKLKDFYPWDLQVVRDVNDAHLPPPEPRGDSSDFVEQLSPIGPHIAHGLLLAVLVLLLLEVVLAWRFGRHTAVEGAASPLAGSIAWPIAVAVLFGLLFIGLGFVRIHAHKTGDFMSFLPDDMRARCEKFLGIPPTAPGEGTFWELVSRGDLFGLGNDFWPSLGIILTGLFLIFCVYRAEGPQISPAYKLLLAALRLFLLLFVLFVLLPQLQLRFDRQSWPDVVLIIDDSRSMGEPDNFTNADVKARASKLGKSIREMLKDKLPAKVAALELELGSLRKKAQTKEDDIALQAEINHLENRLKTWYSQLTQAREDPGWAPSRLQLVQAVLAQPELDWLDYLVNKRRTKVHIYHLDAAGRAIKIVSAQGTPVEITEADPQQLAAARQAVAQLDAEANESRLGTALRQVIDHYRGGSATVIMFSDGVTTRDETIKEVADYAGNKGIQLYFVGIGDAHEVRDLHLYDLQVEDVVRVGDTLNFQAKLVGKGLKDMSVSVLLKVLENGKEVELARKTVKVDEHSWSKFTLQHKPKEKGTKVFIVELEAPKKDPTDKQAGGNRRLVRTVNVLENSLIRVLLVDGTARYDYRFLKSLLERESPDDNNQRSIELKVVLLDADPDYALQDKTALKDFPGTMDELSKFDVIIFGDCDPRDPKLGEQRLRNLVEFVSGVSGKGKASTGKPGGGILFVAGSNYNPHAYKGTPLAEILPIIPGERPSEDDFRDQKFHLKWTPSGRQHQIFKFSADESDSQNIWLSLAPLYWWSRGYTVAPAAEILAVHQSQKAVRARPGQEQNHPLIVQQFVGSGRTMFFGFDESWRWRFREDEVRYNSFWIQTIRYLSRLRISHTDLRLNQQTPYRQGEKPRVFVTFPDNMPLPGQDDAKQQVKVSVQYWPKDKNEPDPEIKTMTLERPGGGGRRFEGLTPWELRRPGKYRYWLTSPDVRKTQPQGENPSAEATVEVPPGELEKLQLNEDELKYAAEKTEGRYYTLANADKLLDDISPARVSLSTPWPPVLLWSNTFCFLLVLGLLTAEWVLRKRKHLL